MLYANLLFYCAIYLPEHNIYHVIFCKTQIMVPLACRKYALSYFLSPIISWVFLSN